MIIGNTVSRAYRVVNLLPATCARLSRRASAADPETHRRRDPRRAYRHHVSADPGDYRRIDGQAAGDDPRNERRVAERLADADPAGAYRRRRIFFLPLMVAASAAVKFKTNMSLAIAIAGVLVHPRVYRIDGQSRPGEHVEFAFIPVTAVKYTYTVIPALVMTVPVVYRALGGSHYPGGDENFLKPMLIVLIAAPLAILLIGPLGIWIGAISALVYTIHSYLGWLSVAIMGGCGRCW